MTDSFPPVNDRLLNDEDDDDYLPAGVSAQTGGPSTLPTVATPEDNNNNRRNNDDGDDEDEREIAAAAAEVSVMCQNSRTQRRDPTGDEAMIGATGNADGVGAFEMVDESGELVKDRFLQFLMEL